MAAFDEFKQHVNMRLLEHEQKYGIRILLWCVRGGSDYGIFRKNSDLDIVVIFESHNNKISAFHDIISHGFDLWGWSLWGCKKTILLNQHSEDKIQYLSPDHARATLSPYFGFFCSMNNKNSVIMKNSKELDELYSLYSPKMILIELSERFYNEIINKINQDNKLSGYEYLSGCWYAFMCRDIINGGRLNEKKFNSLLSYASNKKVIAEINSIRKEYYQSNGKHDLMLKSNLLNQELINQYNIIRQYLDHLHNS